MSCRFVLDVWVYDMGGIVMRNMVKYKAWRPILSDRQSRKQNGDQVKVEDKTGLCGGKVCIFISNKDWS